MPNQTVILWEGEHYWVMRDTRWARHTQIMLNGNVASESVETYQSGPDGEAIAIARAKYLEGQLRMRHAVEYLLDYLKVLTASYSHGNDYAKPEIDAVSEAINILDRVRGTTAVSASARITRLRLPLKCW